MFAKFAFALVLGLMAPSMVHTAPKKEDSSPQVTSRPQNKWQEFYAQSGNCSVKLPTMPEHVSERLKMPDSQYELKYDAYISDLNQNSVYMLLIAQYPDHVDQSYAQSSLEAFLNGILSYNPANQLVFADLTLVNGNEALDFFIRAGAVYFRGRAMLIKNSLYLMAMECEAPSYDEGVYNQFVSSFSFK
jgi:hypothetical protein